jgi:hypothetical protein
MIYTLDAGDGGLASDLDGMEANDTAKMNLSSYSGTGATVYVRSFSGFLIAGT